MNELEYQIRRFHSFLWASGGAYSDFLIHNIDECCWMKDAWPVEARASGGRNYREDWIDQNFDAYSVEYTFGDGGKLYLEGRTMEGCVEEFSSFAHGSKGSAVISTGGHYPCGAKIYKSQRMVRDNIAWKFDKREDGTRNPYQLEWNNLFESIRKDRPHNEAERGTMASLVTVMGRMAAHTGQVIKLDELKKHDHEFAPNIEKLTIGGKAPLSSDENGRYPVPQPGVITNREYEEFEVAKMKREKRLKDAEDAKKKSATGAKTS
jgi:predicted dehydrogenase